MDYKDKIRKLLALAKSPEPEEAKFALLKARKLMAEHKLSERDLEERNTTVIKRAIGETFSKKANSWMDPLSIVIGENYCCSAFRCKISAKTTVWHVGFIGLEGDIEICVKIFRYAVRCIKSEQKKLRKQHRDYYTPQEIAKICDSYGYGFARGVYEAFTRQNEENQEYGLVLKVPKEVKDELEKIGPPKEFKKTPQLTKAVEEMSELTKALCKLKECKRKYDTPFNRETQEVYSNVEEETADVFIMLVQLFAIFNPHELVNITKIVWDKLDRLKDNLDKEAAKQEASDAGKE